VTGIPTSENREERLKKAEQTKADLVKRLRARYPGIEFCVKAAVSEDVAKEIANNSSDSENISVLLE
jgi:hypothetical protein